jgi:hypothetical protein
MTKSSFLGEVTEVASISKASDADRREELARPPRVEQARLRSLRVVLVLIGLIFIFGIYTLGLVWPSGWVWGDAGPRSFIPSHYLVMIIGVYATLGVFLIIASKNPAAHASLIWFTVWSSFVHSGIMAAQGLIDGKEHGHLVGDVPALLIVAIVLAAVAPRGGVAGTPQR